MPPQLARSLHLTYAEKRMRLPWNGTGSIPRRAAPPMPQRGVVEMIVTAGSDVGVRRIVSSTPTLNSVLLKFSKKLALPNVTAGPTARCVEGAVTTTVGAGCGN